MATVVLTLFDGQGSVTDGRTKLRLYASPFGEHNKIKIELMAHCILGTFFQFLFSVYQETNNK